MGQRSQRQLRPPRPKAMHGALPSSMGPPPRNTPLERYLSAGPIGPETKVDHRASTGRGSSSFPSPEVPKSHVALTFVWNLRTGIQHVHCTNMACFLSVE
ncbi:hypothetical protein NL676_032713 [Syzygium grande]|nr:hypothetical protein NL676_032713 [Syzygium grande]